RLPRRVAAPRAAGGAARRAGRREGEHDSRKAEGAAGADAIRARSWFSDGRDPPNAPVRRHSGGMGGRPPTRAKRGKSTQSEGGRRGGEGREAETGVGLRRARPAQRASTPTPGGDGGSSPHASEAREINTVGRRKTRREPTRSAHGPGSQTGATRPTRQYADTRGVWGVVPPPERSEGNQHSRKSEVGSRR